MSIDTVFSWKPVEEKSVFGDIFRPVAIVEIKVSKSNDDWEIFYPQLDSGAVVSVFNESDCELLGYRLKDGELFPLTSAFGEKRAAYVHNVEMRIGSDIIESRVAFTEGENKQQFLGRVDVFDKFQILIRGKIRKSTFFRETHSHHLEHIR